MGDIAEYLTLLQAAKEMGVSKTRMEQHVATGKLPVAAVMGGMRLVLKSDVLKLKADRKPRGRPPKFPPADAKKGKK